MTLPTVVINKDIKYQKREQLLTYILKSSMAPPFYKKLNPRKPNKNFTSKPIKQHKKINIKANKIVRFLDRKFISFSWHKQIIYQNQMHSELHIDRSLFINAKKGDIKEFYTFKGQLGEGAFGKVHLAQQKDQSMKKRAVKALQKQNLKSMVEVMNEMEILKKLDHPNIIKVYETYESEDKFYIVMDYCEGGELYAKLTDSGSFSQQQARQIFKQICYAINYCHKMHVCHRDLKLQNFLFIDHDSLSIKLIDFGLSFQWKDDMEIQAIQKKQNRLTGTSYYLSPEVISKKYDERCDIWSMGVILYMLLTGVPPFPGDTDREILDAVSKFSYTFEIPEMNDVSDEAKDLIKKILVPNHQRLTIQQIFNHPWMKKQEINKKPLRINFGKLKNFSKYSKLKTYAISCIASQLSGKEIQKMGQLFRQIDSNSDGFISTKELRQALEKQREKISLSEAEKLINFIDTDHNGQINYSEFVASLMENSQLYRQQNLVGVFKSLDIDGNGVISTDELRQALSKGNEMDNESIEEIIKLCDNNKDGTIDFKQFLNCISNIN